MTGRARLRRLRRGGFTLAELMVYFALVTTALVVFGGIEITISRSVSMQQALIDIENQAAMYMSWARRDIEAARTVKVEEGKRIKIVRLDGVEVSYQGTERIERNEAGERGRHTFRLLQALEVTRTGPQVEVTATFGETLGWKQKLQRRFRRVATPRREAK